jgi:hypothetical protein
MYLDPVKVAASKTEVAAKDEHGQPKNILNLKVVAGCRLRAADCRPYGQFQTQRALQREMVFQSPSARRKT